MNGTRSHDGTKPNAGAYPNSQNLLECHEELKKLKQEALI